MIDFEEMKRRQSEGVNLIDTLQDSELVVLQHYCSLSTEAIMVMGKERTAPTNQMIINALKAGIGLGLKLEIKNGELACRP